MCETPHFIFPIALSLCSEICASSRCLECGQLHSRASDIMPTKLMMRKRGRTKSSSKSLFFGLWTAPQRAKSLYRAQSDEAGDAQKAWPALPRLPLRLVEGRKHALGSRRRSGQQLRRIYAIRNATLTRSAAGDATRRSLSPMQVPQQLCFGPSERSAFVNSSSSPPDRCIPARSVS